MAFPFSQTLDTPPLAPGHKQAARPASDGSTPELSGIPDHTPAHWPGPGPAPAAWDSAAAEPGHAAALEQDEVVTEPGSSNSPSLLPPGRPTALPPGLAPLPTPGRLFHALRQRFALALCVSLLGAGLTAGILFRLQASTYTAAVWLQLAGDRGQGSGAREDKSEGDSSPTPILFTSPDFRTRLLQQSTVLELPEVNSQAQPQAWLAQAMRLDTSKQGVVYLSVTGQQPETATHLVESATQLYLTALREQRQAHLSQLKEKYSRLAATDSAQPRELPVVRSPGPSRAPPPEAPARVAENPRLLQTEQALEQAHFDLKKQQAALTILQGQATTVTQVSVPESLLTEQLQKDRATQDLQKEWSRLDGLLKQTVRTAVLGENDPQARRYTGQRDGVEQALRQRRRELIQTLEKQVRDKAQADYEPRLASQQERVAVARELERSLQEDLKSLKAAQPKQPEPPRPSPPREEPPADLAPQGTQAVVSAGGMAGKQQALQKLGAEIHLLELEGEEAVGVQHVSEVETTTNSPTKQLQTVLGTGGVFVFLMLVTTWIEFEGRQIRTPRAVTEGLDLPLLGTLPSVPLPSTLAPTPGSNLRDLTSQNLLAEAADVARTLLQEQIGEGPRVLLVAGAQGGEGCTSLACQLALSLARSWKRTLLIDGHLRRPAIHTLLELGMEPGLSEVLRGEIEAQDAIQPTQVGRLWLLPAGHWDPHALQALAQDRQGSVFDLLREQYDVVVIDAGPVLPLADALLLGRHADAAVLSLLCHRSRLHTVHQAQERLTTLGVPVLGAVVSG